MSWLFRKEDGSRSGQAERERSTSPPEGLREKERRVARPEREDGAVGEANGSGEEAEGLVGGPGSAGPEWGTQTAFPPKKPTWRTREDRRQGSDATEAEGAAGPPDEDHGTASPTPTLDEQARCGPERARPAPGGDGPAEYEVGWSDAVDAIPAPPTLGGPRRKRKGRRLEHPAEAESPHRFTPPQRLLLLDTWRRSGLPAKDFAGLVGVSTYTLYKWKRQFEEHGPEGLMDRPRSARRGSRLPELTKRTIVMLKQSHPEWGCQRISDMLLRGPALPASPSAVARVLHEAGYELVEEPTRPHPEKVQRFERAKPNQLWQTDLFTFVLKRQNRRVYLVAFLDDHSRFLVCFGLHASQSTAFVREVLEAGIVSYGPPEEILTDKRRRRATVRALHAVDALRKNSSGVNAADEVERSSTDKATDQQSRQTDQEQHGGTEG